MAEEGGGKAAVETEKSVMLEDVDEGPDHGFGRVGGTRLEPDLCLSSAQFFPYLSSAIEMDRSTFTRIC